MDRFLFYILPDKPPPAIPSTNSGVHTYFYRLGSWLVPLVCVVCDRDLIFAQIKMRVNHKNAIDTYFFMPYK